MSHLLAVLVRLAALALGLAVFYVFLAGTAEKGDANIGAGLLAFGALIVAGFAWSLYDGRRRGAPFAIVVWIAVSAGLAIGWWIALAAIERDASMSFGELLANDVGSVPFILGLVAVPAVAGAFIGGATRRAGVA